MIGALGVVLDLAVEDPALRATVAALTVDLRIDATATAAATATVRVQGRGPWTVDSPAWTAVAHTPAQAVSEVGTALNLSAVAATPHLALHCAVVARGSDAVVLAAGSGTGKTTLTAALLQQDWDYVSDEALVLPWDGAPLVPYPRALALSPWSAAELGVHGVPGRDEELVLPAALGADLARGPLTVRHVVVLRRDGHRPGLAALGRAETVPALWQRGFTHHHDAGRALELLSAVVNGARCWRLDLGPPREQADALGDLLAG